jgi:hypothetical protein
LRRARHFAVKNMLLPTPRDLVRSWRASTRQLSIRGVAQCELAEGLAIARRSA